MCSRPWGTLQHILFKTYVRIPYIGKLYQTSSKLCPPKNNKKRSHTQLDSRKQVITVLKMALCSNIEWNRAYVLPRLCTIDSYLRVFQYKILNNILFLNNRLFKMGKVDSSLCSFCKVTSETITHILWLQ